MSVLARRSYTCRDWWSRGRKGRLAQDLASKNCISGVGGMRKYLGTKGLHATGAPSAIGSRGMGVWGLRNIDRKSLSANNRGPPEAEDPPRSRED